MSGEKILILFLMFLFSLQAEACESDTIVVELTPSQFYIVLHSHPQAVLIDVRIMREYRRERIPGAYAAENREELLVLTDTLDRGEPLFLYCDDITRSRQAGEYLKEAGFLRIYLLAGGMYAWKRDGYETEKGRRRKRNVKR